VHIPEESDSGVVPMNHSNKDGKPSAESAEGRPVIKENARQPNTYPTQSEKRVFQGLAGVRRAARENKEMKFTALLHHLDDRTAAGKLLLVEAKSRTRSRRRHVAGV
jgi:RNA-directed DNA polymerase